MKVLVLYIFLLLIVVSEIAEAQSKLVLNGAIINISEGANLIINSSQSDAITRNSGQIISEGENNKIIWNISTTAGTYEIPFGYGSSDYIPISFTKNAGSGSGSIEFSTYQTTDWLNSNDLPSVINNVNNLSGSDNSAFVINRFWQINAVNYSSNPDLTDLVFTYLDNEISSGGNTIVENNLQAQSWNTTTSKWVVNNTAGIVNNALNQLTVSSVAGNDLNAWWTLVDKTSPLPVSFIGASINCDRETIEILWSTASEFNNDYFSVERSRDGKSWETISIVKGAGNSSDIKNYSAFDRKPVTGIKYYRIKQTDFDGKSDYSEIINGTCDEAAQISLSVYPNPSIGNGYVTLKLSDVLNDPVAIRIVDIYGRVADEIMLTQPIQTIDISAFPKGMYILKAGNNTGGDMFSEKLIIQ